MMADNRIRKWPSVLTDADWRELDEADELNANDLGSSVQPLCRAQHQLFNSGSRALIGLSEAAMELQQMRQLTMQWRFVAL